MLFDLFAFLCFMSGIAFMVLLIAGILDEMKSITMISSVALTVIAALVITDLATEKEVVIDEEEKTFVVYMAGPINVITDIDNTIFEDQVINLNSFFGASFNENQEITIKRETLQKKSLLTYKKSKNKYTLVE